MTKQSMIKLITNREKELEEKMDRWMYLEELAAKIAEQQG